MGLLLLTLDGLAIGGCGAASGPDSGHTPDGSSASADFGPSPEDASASSDAGPSPDSSTPEDGSLSMDAGPVDAGPAMDASVGDGSEDDAFVPDVPCTAACGGKLCGEDDGCGLACVPGTGCERPHRVIDCFGPEMTGCDRGFLETAGVERFESPYGAGPRVETGGQGLLTVVPDGGPVTLEEGTIFLFVRPGAPFRPGEAHVLAQFAVVDGSGQIDPNNRANLLFRDGALEGMLANDVVRTGVLSEARSYEHDVMLPGEWHQLAMTWDREDLRLYIDGGLVARTDRHTAGMNGTFDRLVLGARASGDHRAEGQIARVRVWTERLTHPEIEWLYKEDLDRTPIDVAVRVSGADRVPRDRMEVVFDAIQPELNFHVVPASPIQAGGRILVAFPHSYGKFFNDPPGRVSAILPPGVSGHASCQTSPRLPSARSCRIDLTAGTIPPGSEAVLRLEDVAIRPMGTISRVGASNLRPQVFVDSGGTTASAGALLKVTHPPTLGVVASPTVPRANVFARMPSTVTVGTPFTARIFAEKTSNEPDLGASFMLTLRGPPELEGLPTTYAFVAGPDGSQEIAGLTFSGIPAENPTLLEGTSSDGISLNANPVEVQDVGATEHLYFGDIHGHTTYSDGNEPPEDFYAFAKSRALSFAAITDHHLFGDAYAAPWEISNILDPEEWATLRGLAETHNEPGVFVTIPGYEVSAGKIRDLRDCGSNRCPEVEGDWNVYFPDGAAPLIAADRFFGADGFMETLANVAPGAVVIPHFGGRRADLLAIPPALAPMIPLVEIISNHTSSPDGAEDFALGPMRAGAEVHLGFIGSSDDHTGHPGRSMFSSRLGFVGVWAEALTRGAILEAFRRRHTYATSAGERVIIRSTGNRSSMMGDSVVLPGGEAPTLTLTVTTWRTPSRVALYKNGRLFSEVVPTTTGRRLKTAVVTRTDDTFGTGRATYHWKVIFDGGGAVAWTSPIEFRR